MGEPIGREEFNSSTQRIHKRVDVVEKTTTRIEALFESMKEMVDKMYKIIHGNGSPGIKEQMKDNINNVENSFKEEVNSLKSVCGNFKFQLGLQWILLFLMFSGTFTMAVMIIRTKGMGA